MSRRRLWGEDSTTRIDLTAGASVTLVFKGNFFDLAADERQLISDLSEAIRRHQSYQEDRKNGDAKANV